MVALLLHAAAAGEPQADVRAFEVPSDTMATLGAQTEVRVVRSHASAMPVHRSSYLTYRANFFGNGCYDYRRHFNYPWHDGSCGGCAAPRVLPAVLEPTPAPRFEGEYSPEH
jgi:hypothetical protein